MESASRTLFNSMNDAASPNTQTIGILYALGAGLLWGLVFITPILLPGYSGIHLSVGRYLAFGLIALALTWRDRQQLSTLQRDDWLEAGKLSLVGNLLYYSALAAAIQLSGPPLPTMIIGALPVVIAITANFKDRTIPWRRLSLPLLVITAGIAAVNHAEIQRLQANNELNLKQHALGAVLAIAALICWTWYPIRNSRWLQKKPYLSSSTWSTAQGLTTLPLAIIGYAGILLFTPSTLFGPQPLRYIVLMCTLGFFASWLGTLFWNKASQSLATSLVGQLIVFETLAALLYAYLWRAAMPDWISLCGMLLLISGVIIGVRMFNPVADPAKVQ
jgi:drug/metabolite transporter (DMT)-like permease